MHPVVQTAKPPDSRHSPHPDPEAASRLCCDCGFCCNGVMFGRVVLQALDSRETLRAIGFTVKRKQKQSFFTQPCIAFNQGKCRVYEQRPTRCRLFECKILQKVVTGEWKVHQALHAIEQVQSHVQRIETLLNPAGTETSHKSLLKRVGDRLSDWEESGEIESAKNLQSALDALEQRLEKDFRVI